MQNDFPPMKGPDFRTIAFDDTCEQEMLTFVDHHWDRVIDIRYQTEYAHPGSHDAFLVKIRAPETKKKPSFGDILPR